ncbi:MULTISPECIES: hypothetical protein [Clostridium]|uniref:hypothetical protein n=1 Tax=Clostridium TaxID=1485 RepID=UPI000CF63338|nr:MULTISPECIES: hypothetical protein [Clostridium]NFT07431.1 hypothetical protein [Clostridium botulinum]
MIIDDLRELSLTSTSKGMLYKCIGNISEKKVFIKTGTKLKNKFSILEPISEVIASEIIRKFNIECAFNTLSKMKLPSFKDEVIVNISENFLKENESLIKVHLNELFDIVDKYKVYLSEYRIECIKYLLQTRYNHLIERGIL